MMESSRQERGGRIPAAADAAPQELVAAEAGKMRIVDWLREPDELDDEMGGFAPQRRGLSAVVSSSSPPRKFLPTWLFLFQKRSPGSGGEQTGPEPARPAPSSRCRHKKRRGKEGEEERKEDRGEQLASPDSKAAEGIDGGAGVPALEPAAGRKPEEMSFNLGMGVGMAFVLSRWATEFNKMKELRDQMEMLLKEIRDEIPKKDFAFGILRSDHNVASSSSDCSGDVNKCYPISLRNNRTVFHIEEAKSTTESDRHSYYEISTENRSMDQLEAELAFELEQLELNLEGKDSVMLSERERMELACGSTGSSEVCEPQEGNYNVHCGVSASELERRLYELIQTRQQERIAELESAMELTEKKFIDKEIQVSWRRDTTLLASQQHEEMLSV